MPWRRRMGALAAAFALSGLWAGQGLAASVPDLRLPPDPLHWTLGLSGGVLLLENESYQDFFGVDQLRTWTLRADYRFWRFLRVGAALSASDKSHRQREISFGSAEYPVLYRFSAFQGMAELYLRSHLPSVRSLKPYASFGGLLSRVRAESSGYSVGYDALWEEYRPASDVIQYSSGWRAALGLQFPVWANCFLALETSRIELGDYGEPTTLDPPVGLWDHSGWRLDAGFLQRF